MRWHAASVRTSANPFVRDRSENCAVLARAVDHGSCRIAYEAWLFFPTFGISFGFATTQAARACQ